MDLAQVPDSWDLGAQTDTPDDTPGSDPILHSLTPTSART